VPNFTTIDIDFDVYKLIEAERRGFDEPRIEALRRLLKLPPGTYSAPAHASDSRSRSWSGDGLTLTHGTKLRMRYNGHTHEGEIIDGKWVIEGKLFGSPSGAASGVARTKLGEATRLDGWIYWEAQVPGDTRWTRIAELRPEYVPPLEVLRRAGLISKPTAPPS
jgi:hypothetical protein